MSFVRCVWLFAVLFLVVSPAVAAEADVGEVALAAPTELPAWKPERNGIGSGSVKYDIGVGMATYFLVSQAILAVPLAAMAPVCIGAGNPGCGEAAMLLGVIPLVDNLFMLPICAFLTTSGLKKMGLRPNLSAQRIALASLAGLWVAGVASNQGQNVPALVVAGALLPVLGVSGTIQLHKNRRMYRMHTGRRVL